MVKYAENFLTKEECQYFINLIDKKHNRSSVSTTSDAYSEVSDFRTSSTSQFDKNDKVVKALQAKIANYLGLDINRGEYLQGQLYEPGQYFKPHADYFPPEAYKAHCLSSGNRVKTLMIYLNEDMIGGETDFTELGIKFKPKTGRAIRWDNMIDGKVNTLSMHEGTPVVEGKKYIITSWWRENEYNPVKDAELKYQLDNKEQTKVISLNTKTFSSIADFPKFTKAGYKVIKCPEDSWGLIQDAYNLLKHNKVEENWDGLDNVITPGDKRTEIMSFDNLVSLRSIIHEQLKPLHEEFSGESLTPTMLYGIRSYNKGATLINHTDRLETHHVSSIIIVDKDLDCDCIDTKGAKNDWPLDFQDHNGEWHKVYAEIGDIILYESATCMHGRQEEFKGNWFRNFYVHYKLNDFKYSNA